jgi:hypothetical protein
MSMSMDNPVLFVLMVSFVCIEYFALITFLKWYEKRWRKKGEVEK